MADETNNDRPPQLTGIVIITLPPPDNPSLGKTITAFTLSDNQTSSTSQSTHQVDETPPPLPHNLGRQQPLSSLRIFSHSIPRSILRILGISLIALYLWGSISQEALFGLRDDYVDNDDDDHKNKLQTTFIFPLYRKPYGGNGDLGDVELKLGRFRGWNEVNGKINKKSVSTASKIDSTSVIPLGGNVYLDG